MKNKTQSHWGWSLNILALLLTLAVVGLPDAQAQQTGAKKPNIVIIWGDDIGQATSAPTPEA